MKNNKKIVLPFIALLIFSVGFGVSAIFSKGENVLGFSDTKTTSSQNTSNVVEANNTKDDMEREDSVIGNQVSSGLQFSSYEEQEKYINNLMKDFGEKAVVEKTTPLLTIPANSQASPNKRLYNKQFVAIAFDGSYSLSRWKSLLEFSDDSKLQNKDIHFTFFISGVYLISDSNKKSYTAPRRAPGQSSIGFGGNAKSIEDRISLIEQASRDGHEIGSHVNGHFDGSSWSYEEWLDEFNQFKEITSKINIPTIKGFRAPLLAVNGNTYPVLKDSGYLYDTSGVASMNTPPWKDMYSIWHFPLVSLKLGGKNTLSMDYNHYVAQTQGQSTAKRGTPEWQKYYDEVYNSYIGYFEHNYNGSRIPINIGHHFSLWNDGVYYEALLAFAENVCGRPDVICGTYSELVNLLETNTL